MNLYRFILCLETIYEGAGYELQHATTDYHGDDRCKRLAYAKDNDVRSISTWFLSNGEVVVTYCNDLKSGDYVSKWLKI